MYDLATDGRLQVIAGVSLLECSCLVKWAAHVQRFSPINRSEFESRWAQDVDPMFGRLICWINFSAGAEFLAKGVCLLHGVEIRKPQTVPVHPTGLSANLSKWAMGFRNDWKSFGTVESANFGTLGNLVYKNSKTKADPHLLTLCKIVKATCDQQEMLLAAYTLLAKTIRNRDAHAYVPNVRDSHYSLVPDLFAQCFNLLVSWLPDGPGTLNKWKKESRQFIDSL